MIKAIVFDLDGVPLDSEPVWEAVRRQVVAETGGHWNPDTQSRLMGMSTAEWANFLTRDTHQIPTRFAPQAWCRPICPS